MSELNLGPLNGHAVGRILKEAVRRASTVIRAERSSFEAHAKRGYSGSMDDVFTSADRAAQEVYLRTFAECFPGCGVIAEEAELRIPARAPVTAYFTVDPLDGTKAFIRRQSHGIATMVALVEAEEVLSAYVGDVSADEVYGFRPGSSKVHRITRLDTFETLGQGGEPRPFGVCHALLRDPPDRYGPEAQALVKRFGSYEIMGSSIGAWAARLWKGEVEALLYPKGYDTPWDMTPVIGITRKLGFRHLKPEDGAWRVFEPTLPLTTTARGHDVLVMHASRLRGDTLNPALG
jgi:fructose-1,6-bisphosphatase/inositol monophosphatase family enzyme